MMSFAIGMVPELFCCTGRLTLEDGRWTCLKAWPLSLVSDAQRRPHYSSTRAAASPSQGTACTAWRRRPRLHEFRRQGLNFAEKQLFAHMSLRHWTVSMQ